MSNGDMNGDTDDDECDDRDPKCSNEIPITVFAADKELDDLVSVAYSMQSIKPHTTFQGMCRT